MSFVISKAGETSLSAIKGICDQHKTELGFIITPILKKYILKEELLIASVEGEIVGFLAYHHRLDSQTTLYSISVLPNYRLQGIGKGLINTLISDCLEIRKEFILLKCPLELSSNAFYLGLGFVLSSVLEGKDRKLNVWRYDISHDTKS